MAVCEIWDVRGRLDHPIDYAENPEKTANPKSLMSVLALNVNQNDVIVVTAQGEDEEEAIAGMEGFVRENL